LDDIDVTIIGAGVVGLAVAARLAGRHRSVVILERNPKFGQETSSRNSEVIHSGIYYPPGTLKARLCVRGNAMLYDYCERTGINHRKTGKLVVASDGTELEYLQYLMGNGTKNGAPGLKLLDAGGLKDLEPEIKGTAALLAPSTGILDTHGLMASLLGDARAGGAEIAYNSEATGVENLGGGFRISVNNDYDFKSMVVINSAGLISDKVAAMAGIDIDEAGYRLHYCKGQYFRVTKSLGVRRLVYPVPPKNIQSLGIHLVLELGGGTKFGPDAVYVDRVDYAVDEGRKEEFCNSVRKYLPSIMPDDLSPDTAGVRPKLQVDGGPFRDFVICHEKERGLDGLINLIGIDSPGLTSALAIAEHVGGLVDGCLAEDNS